MLERFFVLSLIMRVILSFLFFLTFFPAVGQKHTVETIEADGIKKIVFSSDEVYGVELVTHKGEDIKITTHTEGEYFNNISLDSEVRNGTLFLNSRFRETLRNGYDKLSAHKVFSMEVKLEVPEGLIAEIISNVASVTLSGKFETVLVQLKSGSCYLKNFSGNAVVNTYNGNIVGDVHPAEFEATSRTGQVSVPDNIIGNHKMVLTSINGNIKITQTK